MKRTLMAIGSALGLLVASTAYGQEDYNKTIDRLGVQLAAYFSVAEGFSINCRYGVIYVDLSTVSGRAAYAQLLAAKLAGRKLSRIVYVQPNGTGTECTLELVEILN